MTPTPVLAVFVPGALAGGLLVSIALLVGDLVRRVRGDRSSRRAVDIAASATADEVRFGHGCSRAAGQGLRDGFVYGIVALVSLAIVVLVVPGAVWNFLDEGGYLSDIGWILAVSLLAVGALAVVGVVALRLAPAWAPILAAMIGVGAVVRLAAGPEEFDVALVVVVGLAVTAVVVAFAYWWSRRVAPGVPAWTRPMLRACPLGRVPS